MAPVIADCFEVTIRGTQPNGEFANVFHWVGLGGAPPDAEGGAQLVLDSFCARIVDLMTAQFVVTGADYIDLSSVGGATGSVTPTAGPTAGGSTGFGAPSNVTGLIRWSALGTRTQRDGRTYIGGVDEDLVDTAGQWTSGALTAWDAAILLFLGDLDGNSVQLVVLSKAPGGTFEPRTITGGTMAGQVATQRRRLRH